MKKVFLAPVAFAALHLLPAHASVPTFHIAAGSSALTLASSSFLASNVVAMRSDAAPHQALLTPPSRSWLNGNGVGQSAERATGTVKEKVAEPSTAAMLLAGGSMLLLARRRRQENTFR